METTKKDYFISYTTRTKQDEDWAKWTEWFLRTKFDKTTIMQEYDSMPGVNFKMFMHNALLKANTVVCILTNAYLTSDNCTEEWINAEHCIFLKFDNCTPEGLLRYREYIDLYGLDEDAVIKKITKRFNQPVRSDIKPPYKSFSNSDKDKPLFPIFNTGNLPNKNQNFTGREIELEKISLSFEKGSIVTLVGAGGFGKSQLALEYAHRHKAYYDYIWIFNAESEIILQTSYRNFATYLGLKLDDNEDFSLTMLSIKQRLLSIEKYLLIYDNAEGTLNLEQYLPDEKVNGHILVNTRDNCKTYGETIPVETFTEQEAVNFVKKRLKDKISDEEAIKLSKALGRLPLALEHATAYIIQTPGQTYAGYFELLEKYGIKTLNQKIINTDYQKTISATWQISIDQIKLESAKHLFNLLAYFAPEDIPLFMFIEGREVLYEELREDLADKLKLNRIITEITRYSLVECKNDKDNNSLFSMHRLIQETIRLTHENDTTWLNICLDLAYKVFKYEYGNKLSMDSFLKNVPHIIEIANLSEKTFSDKGLKEKIAFLFSEAGRGFNYNGNYNEALEWHNKTLVILKKVLGTEHLNTATTYNNIALVYKNQGVYPKALEWYNKALVIKEKVLGKEHPDTATTYNNIAGVFDNQGDYPKALEWFNIALIIKEKVLSKEHPDTAAIYNNIALVYNNQGDYLKALEWYNKALVVREKVLGTEHPSTATTYNNIASVYNHQGDYPKALKWYNKALVIREKVLGKEHPDTATTYNNIAGIYKNQGDYPKALEWFNIALVIYEKVLGKKHPNTATTYNDIALVYNHQGDYPKALEWFNKALVIREKVLGKEHPDTAATYNNIALVYKNQGDYIKALELYIKAYKIVINKLGESHPNTKIILENMEAAYENSGLKEPFKEWLSKNQK